MSTNNGNDPVSLIITYIVVPQENSGEWDYYNMLDPNTKLSTAEGCLSIDQIGLTGTPANSCVEVSFILADSATEIGWSNLILAGEVNNDSEEVTMTSPTALGSESNPQGCQIKVTNNVGPALGEGGSTNLASLVFSAQLAGVPHASYDPKLGTTPPPSGGG